MKKLQDLVELISNTEDAVVLKVKEGVKVDLICLGCFNGDEDIIRLTKGETVTCTIWTTKGTHYYWQWGPDGTTLVTDQLSKKGHMILDTIQGAFDILVKGAKSSIVKDIRGAYKIHKIFLWRNAAPGYDCGCRKDNEFYKFFETVNDAIKHFESLGYRLNPCIGEPGYFTLIKN